MKSRTTTILAVLLIAFSAHASEFSLQWQGARPWAGPQTWANPLQDWKVENGALIGAALNNRTLHQVVHHVGKAEEGFELSTRVEFITPDKISMPDKLWAGFAVGLQGLMDDPRHVLVGAQTRIVAGLRADGKAFVGDKISEQNLTGNGAADLRLTYALGTLTLTASRNGKNVVASAPVTSEKLHGNIALATESPRPANDARGPIYTRFAFWKGSGKALVEQAELSFGPILWSQYTRQNNGVKLLAQLAPLGTDDPRNVSLEIEKNGAWQELNKADFEPLTRTAILRGEVPDGRVNYRVRYAWQGQDYFWTGTFIPDPAQAKEPLKIGAFSCDHGYAFPLPIMTRNVQLQKPNLVFFAGDQIYEEYGGFGVTRTPVETAMLDYLRKWYQFGWTWREVLKDCPSIILPDDHDVFQGNLWGQGGRPIKKQEMGGYVMPAEWVNGIQRTQTGHLPDAVDPAPIEQNISVYFTKFNWGDVPFAIVEDRKWKNGPDSTLPKNRFSLSPKELDVEGAQLLGERQEKFLNNWAQETQNAPLRFIMSQTIFAKIPTHGGPELKPGAYDFDSGGWPQSGRVRALSPFKDGHTFMLHGDQHFGVFLRHGINDWNDGPYAFMVPGTANGWPRAFWPEGDKIAGNYTDPFGNKFTVFAAANPEKGSNILKTRREGHPEESAQHKGSGYGVIEVDPQTRAVTFNMWHYQFDAAKPQASDQFPGFPQTIKPQ